MANYEILRQRHAEQYRALVQEYIERIRWTPERLRVEQQQQLRKLLRKAKEDSPWHRRRLSRIDPDQATKADLRAIPPMTKKDLMRDFEAILTDRRLSQQMVESHIDHLESDSYLLDEYHVVASGGSSGTRGVFVYDWDGWLKCALTMMKWRMQVQLADPTLGLTAVRANIAGGKATHMTYAMAQTFGHGSGVVNVAATLPVSSIVKRLNELQPVMLSGYPSMISVLAREAQDGRLRIAPRKVWLGSEPVLPEMRAAIETAWGNKVYNIYGTSEGASAGSCGHGQGLHLNEDSCIFEPVDKDGQPVGPGEHAAKMYVTPLFNHVQPLIRYELTDEVTLIDEPCSCGSVLRRIDDIQGRADDVFIYPNGVVVHPIAFRSPLGREHNILEYQVRQTERGATITIRAQGQLNMEALKRRLEQELVRLGLQNPAVTIEVVSQFDRSATGKLKRFFPSTGA
jgi:phenylacetate-CoA ligase